MRKKKSSAMGPSVLKEVWKVSWRNPSSLLFMLFLDAAFVIALLLQGTLMEMIAPALDASALFREGPAQIWYSLFVLIVYALILLFLYSLVKYAALRSVGSLITPPPAGSGVLGFYGLNILLLIAFGAIGSVIFSLVAAAKQPYAWAMFLLLVIPSAIAFFIVLSAAQSIFHATGAGALRSLGRGFLFLFKKFSAYRNVAGVSVLFILAYAILLLLMGMGIRSVSDTNYPLYVSLYGLFTWVMIILTTLLGYALLLFNRIGFYLIVQEEDRDDSAQS